ncbi:hypothetical protein FTUN_7001 [Frigoriglobus tundricola]|uniref:Uncharacterized protein n=1 Tax=Frigoriglobus tundricola TaxID=2774151 RepID=A0A6M5YZB3_9BACT|nr:hypothetical protein FTUN_7001 [Frigoriglobus tundricola]
MSGEWIGRRNCEDFAGRVRSTCNYYTRIRAEWRFFPIDRSVRFRCPVIIP